VEKSKVYDDAYALIGSSNYFGIGDADMYPALLEVVQTIDYASLIPVMKIQIVALL
jgi:hypothetical protein